MGDLGAVLGVNDHAAALVELEANVLEAEVFGVRATADGDKDDVSFELSQVTMRQSRHLV
jgi:hypothetical protein